MGGATGYTKIEGENAVRLRRIDENYPYLNVPVPTPEATSLFFWTIRHLEDKDAVELEANNPMMTSRQLILPGKNATSRIKDAEISVDHEKEEL